MSKTSPIENFRGGYTEIVTTAGKQCVAGLVFDAFHIRPCNGDWVITHMPSGMSIPAAFMDMENAAEAVDEIRNLSSSWANLSADEWKRLRAPVKAICENLGILKSSSPELKASSVEMAKEYFGASAR